MSNTKHATEAKPTVPRTAKVEFHGRSIEVKVPTDGQLAVMTRFWKRYQPGPDGQVPKFTSGEEAARVLARALDIATCVIVDQRDADWVEDLVMDGTVQLADTTVFAKDAIEVLATVNPGMQMLDVEQPPATLVTT